MIRGKKYAPWKISEIMNLEDDSLKQYILIGKRVVHEEQEIKIIDNEEKLGFYFILKKININKQGKVYIKSRLSEWIVYDKKNKKVKISKTSSAMKEVFIEKYFEKNMTKLISKFIIKLTATLCKKIIEGKISSIDDIISYHKSYTIRDKSMDNETIYKFFILGVQYSISLFNDPSSIQFDANFNALSDVSPEVAQGKVFKIDFSELNTLNGKYREWASKQNKKYVTLFGRRDGENVDNNESEIKF